MLPNLKQTLVRLYLVVLLLSSGVEQMARTPAAPATAFRVLASDAPSCLVWRSTRHYIIRRHTPQYLQTGHRSSPALPETRRD